MKLQTRNYIIKQDLDIRNLILNALIDFKFISQQLKQEGSKGKPLTNLALYTLLLLHNNSQILRNDIMKRFHVNYYDAGNALEGLINNGLVNKEEHWECNSIKSMRMKRTRYRLTLNGEILINDILGRLTAFKS